MTQSISYPCFSVLMSLYHAEKPESLDACLNSMDGQTVTADQIVIVYDGEISNDLIKVVEKWTKHLPIDVVRLATNLGLGRALNIGLEYCRYSLVARMDTDDICVPERFELQLLEFLSSDDLSISGGYIKEFSGSIENVLSERRVPLNHSNIINGSAKLNPFNHMTVMYKKEHVVEAGGYQHLPWMEDWYLWLRMLSKGFKASNLNEYLVYARTGKAMISRRSGTAYIKSEWLMTRIKVRLHIATWYQAFAIFLYRSFPRIAPNWLLLRLYIYSRNNNAK